MLLECRDMVSQDTSYIRENFLEEMMFEYRLWVKSGKKGMEKSIVGRERKQEWEGIWHNSWILHDIHAQKRAWHILVASIHSCLNLWVRESCLFCLQAGYIHHWWFPFFHHLSTPWSLWIYCLWSEMDLINSDLGK